MVQILHIPICVCICVLQAPEVGTMCLPLDKVDLMRHSTLNKYRKLRPHEENDTYKSVFLSLFM